MTSTPTPTFSDSPTFTSSPTITQTFTPYRPNIQLSLKVYNSAGEVVYTVIENLSLGTSVNGLQSGGGALMPDIEGSRAVFELLGSPGLNLNWDGSNSSGQKVQSGTYYAKAEVLEQSGSISTYSAAISVVRLPVTLQASVYNSAGELVRSLKAPEAGAFQISALQFSNGQLLLGGGAPLKAFEVRDRVGALMFSWDGRNDQGNFVSGGLYVLKVESILPGDSRTVAAKSVEVLRLPSQNPLEGALIAPNPLLPKDKALLLILPQAAPGQEISAQLFNIAGERIASADNRERYDRIQWDLASIRLSSGTYFVSLRTESNGVQSRILKLEIIR